MRLDVLLQTKHSEISRSVLQRLIRSGKVSVNGVIQQKTGANVSENDKVAVDFAHYTTPISDVEGIEVLHEDKDCGVINKPVDVLTHSKGGFNPEGTVASWLSKRKDFSFPKDNLNERSGIIHRLDRATSGVMVCAKNPASLKHFQKQFQQRKVKKTYVARIEGQLKHEEAIIDLPIERNPKHPQRFRVGQNGKQALTNYRVLKVIQTNTGEDSLVELKPLTGRTHQLRVHLDYLKHPIVGDTFYKGRAANRLYLHASQLELTMTNSERRVFEAPVPEEFDKLDTK